MIRWLIEELYYLSAQAACWVYLRRCVQDSTGTYVAQARVYFEYCEDDDFVGWPWKWRLTRFDCETHEERLKRLHDPDAGASLDYRTHREWPL